MKKLLIPLIIISVAIGAFFTGSIDEMKASFVPTSQTAKPKDLFVVVAGHGSKDKNQYLTAGKQSPEWASGLKIYEGYSCKILAYDLVMKLIKSDYDATLLNPDAFDMTLVERANKVNQMFKSDRRVVVISLHHNAQSVDCSKADYKDKDGLCGYTSTSTGGATGIEIYTSPGQTRSDMYATYIFNAVKTAMPQYVYRTDTKDGDPDKEAYFYILTHTNSPALLIEWGFMTTYSPDCLMISNDSLRDVYTTAIVTGLKNYDNDRKN